MDLIYYTFFQNALIGSFLTAIVCGMVGTYIVSKRLVFISGGITHASFGGLGLGFYMGINPILSALLFSVLAAFGVEWASRSQGVREDSAIAGIWSLGMALGVVFEVRSRSIPLPGEGLVIAVSVVSRQPFYRIKIGNDITMVILAAILGFFCLNEIYGIREGTLISVFLVGILVKFISRFLDRIWPIK